MTLEEALGVLGLNADATSEIVTARYHELALTRHSDAGGTDEAMAQLNIARERILESRTSALVPIDLIAPVMQQAFDSALQTRRREEATTRAETRVLRLALSPVDRAKSLAVGMGGMSAIVAALTTQIGPLLKGAIRTGAFPSSEVTLAFGIFAAISAAWYLGLDAKAKRLAVLVHAVADNLSDKAFLIDVLQQSLPADVLMEGFTISALAASFDTRGHSRMYGRLHSPLTLLESERDDYTIGEVASRVGAHEVARLVTSKGLDGGLLRETKSVVTGHIEIRFVLLVD